MAFTAGPHFNSTRTTLSRLGAPRSRACRAACTSVAVALPITRRSGSAPSRPTDSPGCSVRDNSSVAARIVRLDPRGLAGAHHRDACGRRIDDGAGAGVGRVDCLGDHRGAGAGVGATTATSAGAAGAGSRRRAPRPAPVPPRSAPWRPAARCAARCRRSRSSAATAASATPRAALRPQGESGSGQQQHRHHPEHRLVPQANLARLLAARAVLERRLQAVVHPLEQRTVHRRQQLEHRLGIDLQHPAHALRQRAHERGVGQLVVAVGLERLELGLRHLDRRRQRRDVQALALARGAQHRARAARLGARRLGVSHRSGPARRPATPATAESARATGGRSRARRAGCPSCSRCARPATASARWCIPAPR